MSTSSSSTVLDNELLREVWSGSVTVAIFLNPADLGTLESPAPLYLSLPRYAYITMFSTDIRKHFESFATALGKQPELWFTATDNAQSLLKWNWPLGVLYDLYAAAHTPWPITVHWSAYPSERLLRCPDDDTVKSHFLHSLKEAVCMRHGDVDAVNQLDVLANSNLWAGILRNEMEVYWTANRQIYAHISKSPWKSVSIRLARPGAKTLTQEPISPIIEGRDATLLDVLSRIAPDALDLIDPSRNRATLRAGVRVVVQGISPPLEASVSWLSTYLASADNFLYIVVLSDS